MVQLTNPKTQTIAIDIDYYPLFKTIQKQTKINYMFESLSEIRHQDNFVSIGFDPIFVVSARQNTLIFEGDLSLIFPEIIGKLHTLEVPSPYYYLRNLFPQNLNCKTRQGGLIGYFGYETINYFEKSINLPEHPDFEQFKLGFYQDGLIFDNITGELRYYFYFTDRSQTVLDFLKLETKLDQKLEKVEFLGNNVSKEEHSEIIKNTLEQINLGNSFQVEIGLKTNYNIQGDKFLIYDKLREINPSPFMFYLGFGKQIIFGSSPEILISCTNQQLLATPVAGTIRRGEDIFEDRKLARELLNDPKEISEHNMLIDLHRNDLGKIAKFGSVRIDNLMYIIKFSHVQHIVTDVVATKDDKYDSLDVLACILPGGVLTGAPKIETIKIIANNEKEPRGPYGGAVGRFSFNGDCAFALPIRSLFCFGDKCYSQTCGGIVLDSMPEKEYDEIFRKASAMENTIRSLF
jgi:anthranilate synthase component I